MATVLTTEEYDAYIHKHETWNFVVNMLDLTFYNLAVSFVFGSTVLSLYASYLTSSALLIGLIPAIQSVGYFLPQLLLARQTEQLSRKKPLVQRISVMERLPYLVIALGILLWPDAPTWLAYAVLALGLATATGCGGLAGPAWKAMLTKVVPVERRGRLFGLSTALGGLLGVVGATYSRHVLATFTYPTSFGICFLLCFVSHIVSWIGLSLNREPPREPSRQALPARVYFRRLPSLLRNNPNYTRYLISRSLIILGAMSTAFYVVYAKSRFQVSDSFAGDLTIAALVSQTLSTPVLGWLGDRRGHKWLTEICTVIGASGVLLILLAPSAVWLYVVFVLVNAATSGLSVAGLSIMMEFCDPEDIPTFEGLGSTLLAVPILASPVIGGWLVDVAGFQVLFVAALAFAAGGLGLMHWGVREPRHEVNARGIAETQV